ncbi:hypothetical protein M4I21_15805 [Cellulophaga sp. 20_2_10]|uniref:hypothetical protein n=1 Tax=Cellulophaga sp. 20_2_10 TaxID=2942476 RepID=UPI00201B3043|nr:hypothetical protein [Cellulophaga sp. 20_2_10]MCL5247287.1 hypothetical protein [Cellulophaga sp. 20_2_10]
MKNVFVVAVVLCLFHSCIPLRVAPNIQDYKITKGKTFKRGLPRQQVFVFEDPKNESEFYKYIDTKFQLYNTDVFDNVPFFINSTPYYFSFYEVEKKDKSIDILTPALGALANRAIGSEEDPSHLFNDEAHVRIDGNYYIAIIAYDESGKDCLDKKSLSRPLVLNYLRALKEEYLVTHNYNEVLFKN